MQGCLAHVSERRMQMHVCQLYAHCNLVESFIVSVKHVQPLLGFCPQGCESGLRVTVLEPDFSRITNPVACRARAPPNSLVACILSAPLHHSCMTDGRSTAVRIPVLRTV